MDSRPKSCSGARTTRYRFLIDSLIARLAETDALFDLVRPAMRTARRTSTGAEASHG